MRSLSHFFIAFFVCTFSATTAFGLILAFGQQEIADAGAGCVAGYTSDHASQAYFQGDTATLNERLALLAKEDRHLHSVKVILHAGAFKIDDPEETLITDEKNSPAQIPVDWSVRRLCPTEKVLARTWHRGLNNLPAFRAALALNPSGEPGSGIPGLGSYLIRDACRCDQREIVVDIWVANEIKLDDLRVPKAFKVESAVEIERFVKRHANQE